MELIIEDLSVSIEDKTIIDGLNLRVPSGEIHVIMGPNGCGKSTLSYVLAGRPGYQIASGKISVGGQDLLAMSIEERAIAGLFVALQYPVEIPGVAAITFLRTCLNALRKGREQSELDMVSFTKLLRSKAEPLNIDMAMLKRSMNVGFSGGEKKRNEILQMSLFEPSLIVLDEPDSGVDVDAMKLIAEQIKQMRQMGRSFIIITHYQKLLDYIAPDRVHIMQAGRIVKDGDMRLAEVLDNGGYAKVLQGE